MLKFIGVLFAMYITYSILFHYIAIYEEVEGGYSWITGFYWTLVTMSTLGFGDIVFHSDIGRLFSMVVLFSGVLFLLILLPFTFIEFFYAPWLKAQNQARAPNKVDDDIKDHIIISKLDSITEALIKKLEAYKIDYVILEPDLQKALDLSDLDYNVVNLDPTDLETYNHLQIEKASMFIASGTDTENTNAVFTVEEVQPDLMIVATATSPDSIDVLQLAGANHVLKMGEILGRALARRTLGGDARVHVIGHIDRMVIAETTVKGTPLIGKTIKESNIREKAGVNIVGIWERGLFKIPYPDTIIRDESVLVLAGTVAQLRAYDELLSIYHVSDHPVIIIGGGRVGRAAAKSLEERGINYRVIEKKPDLIMDDDNYILGDAADIDVLHKAGIDQAHTALITTHDDDINIYLTIYCRQLSPEMQIISRTTYERNINTMHRAGADFVMSYASMGANSIFNILEGQDAMVLAEGLNVFNHRINKKLAGKTLIESNIRQETGCTVIAIDCEDENMDINPSPDTVLELDKEIVLIGSFEAENAFNKKYE
ncbi:MAG: NAD-binding protein [Balneolaceae bacterium]|nr:NAD-binding protein [Balneolaceae bacterium]